MTEPPKTWSTPVVREETRLIPCALCGSLSFKPSLFCGDFSYVRCAACGLVQMNPQPLEAEIKRRYGALDGAGGNSADNLDRCGGVYKDETNSAGHGEDYLAYELANEDAFLNLALLALNDADFDQFEKTLAEALTRSRNGNAPEESGAGGITNRKPRVLDIGCATGSVLAALRERGWETCGVEISVPQAEYARRERNLDVRNLPLEQNNFPAAYFDAVLASHLIEHLNNPAAMVREVRRILAPEGRFFVTTPNIAGFQARLFGDRWRSAIFDHLYLFSAKTLRRLLRENGFEIEKTAMWGGLAAGTAPAPVKRLFDRAAKRFGFGDVMIVRAKRDNPRQS